MTHRYCGRLRLDIDYRVRLTPPGPERYATLNARLSGIALHVACQHSINRILALEPSPRTGPHHTPSFAGRGHAQSLAYDDLARCAMGMLYAGADPYEKAAILEQAEHGPKAAMLAGLVITRTPKKHSPLDKSDRLWQVLQAANRDTRTAMSVIRAAWLHLTEDQQGDLYVAAVAKDERLQAQEKAARARASARRDNAAPHDAHIEDHSL